MFRKSYGAFAWANQTSDWSAQKEGIFADITEIELLSPLKTLKQSCSVRNQAFPRFLLFWVSNYRPAPKMENETLWGPQFSIIVIGNHVGVTNVEVQDRDKMCIVFYDGKEQLTCTYIYHRT